MARSARGGGGRSVSRPAPARKPAPSHSVPQTRSASSVPAPAQSSGGGMMSGIGSTIAQGMAFGTGSAIAHRAVGAVAGSFGGGTEAAAEQQLQAPEYAQGAMGQPQQQFDFSAGACAQDKTMFYDCLQSNRGDQQACQFLYDQLKQCQMNEPKFG
ncbi:hypothetical protein MPSEU_000729400 [Mayamaea pseudoterrestris]|nr:hypothetical protein MPSEU_000729400 [Mayamaea pseudoterrestris]